MLLLTPHSVPDPTQLPAHPALGFALSRAASERHVTPSQSWEQLFGTVKVFLCCVVSVPTGLQVSEACDDSRHLLPLGLTFYYLSS